MDGNGPDSNRLSLWNRTNSQTFLAAATPVVPLQRNKARRLWLASGAILPCSPDIGGRYGLLSTDYLVRRTFRHQRPQVASHGRYEEAEGATIYCRVKLRNLHCRLTASSVRQPIPNPPTP